VKSWGDYRRQSHDVGWSLGRVSALDLEERTIWIVDANGYGKRFVCGGADEKLNCICGTGIGY
jgi:hypothetical protein